MDERTGDKVTTMRVPAQQQTAPATPKSPREKKLNRVDVCPGIRLKTEDDVDKYVDSIRAKLLEALQSADSVRLG